MRYGSTSDATDWTDTPTPLGVRVVSALLFFIPRANPDLEHLYPRIKKWFLEVDEEGYANRAIAVDEEGEPIFRTPDARNLGFWPDRDRKFTEADLDPISQSEFERLRLAAEGWIDRRKAAEPCATDNLGYAQRIREGSSFRSSEAGCLSFIVGQDRMPQGFHFRFRRPDRGDVVRFAIALLVFLAIGVPTILQALDYVSGDSFRNARLRRKLLRLDQSRTAVEHRLIRISPPCPSRHR